MSNYTKKRPVPVNTVVRAPTHSRDHPSENDVSYNTLQKALSLSPASNIFTPYKTCSPTHFINRIHRSFMFVSISCYHKYNKCFMKFVKTEKCKTEFATKILRKHDALPRACDLDVKS